LLRCEPELIFYLAGADPHEGDRLGRLHISFAGLQLRDAMVLDWARSQRIPIAMAMAGGYGKVISDTVQVQINTFTQAYLSWQHWQIQSL
jgi:acetoin utilization deacetylase AcuC-like enzyme